MSRRQDPSALQQAILRFIWQYLRRHDRPPAYREIESAVGVRSLSVVSYHVRQLEARGYLHRARHVARGLRLTKEALRLLEQAPDAALAGANVVRLRITGDIRAGAPVDFGNDTFDTYDVDETIVVDRHLLPRNIGQLTALRVRGNSMVDALVQDGDIVILQPEVEVGHGDMVAAWLQLEQELTLKHFFREGDQVCLEPANRTMAPIYSHAANVAVQGRVVLVVRPPAVLRPGAADGARRRSLPGKAGVAGNQRRSAA